MKSHQMFRFLYFSDMFWIVVCFFWFHILFLGLGLSFDFVMTCMHVVHNVCAKTKSLISFSKVIIIIIW